MKKLFSILCLLICANSFATNYYFSTAGNDANTGLIGSPWHSIAKFNSVFASKAPGDNFLFNRGDIFFGTLIISRSGLIGLPIVIGAYGSGAQPVITGFTNVVAWTNLGSNIWESTSAISTLPYINLVAINGANVAMGRTPNTGYYQFQSFATTSGTVPNQITSSNLNSSVINYTGAELAMNLATFRIVRNRITSQVGSQLNYTPDPEGSGFQTSGGKAVVPNFIIQNDIRTLDQQGEWYYNPSTKKLDIYSTSTPTGVQIPTLDSLIIITNFNYITFDNISFTGANSEFVKIDRGQHITFQNCSFEFSGIDGIFGTPTGNSIKLSVLNCSMHHINNNGIDVPYGNTSTVYFDSAIIRGNDIKNCGMIYGEIATNDGRGNANTAQAIAANGANTLIELNTIDSMGFMGIRFYAGGSIVQKNYIKNIGFFLNDGGGIYTWNGSRKTVQATCYVLHNIMINPQNDAGVNSALYGPYMDDFTNNVVVRGNTSSGLGWGAEIHNAFNIVEDSNTYYNNSMASLVMIADSNITTYVAGHTNMDNISLTNNIFFAKFSGQKTLWDYRTCMPLSGLIPTNFNSNNNFFARPIVPTNDNSILTNYQAPSNPPQLLTLRTLPMWQTYSGQDGSSGTTPLTISNVNQLDFEYNATSAPVVKTLPPGVWKDVYNNSYSSTTTLQPFTSVVLINTGTSNIPPVANAGTDQSATWPVNSVTLSGSGTDADGTIASYVWSKISGPASNGITGAGSPTASVTGLSIGTYQFQLQVTDNSGATGTDVVGITENQGTATLAFSNLTQTYSGLALSPTLTTTPAGISTSLTLGGVTGGRINAGTYAAVGGITDPNWTATSISGTFTINKAAATITATNQTFNFDGLTHTITATTTPAGLTGLTHSYSSGAAPSAIGVYHDTVRLVNSNYTASQVVVTITIVNNPAIIFISDTTKVFNGSPQCVTVTCAYSFTLVNGCRTSTGSQTVTATINDGIHTGSDTATLTIAKKKGHVTLAQSQNVAYGTTFTSQQLSSTIDISGTISYVPTFGDLIPLGTSTITATLTPTDTANYIGDVTTTTITSFPVNPFLNYFIIVPNGQPFFIKQ
jgi:hypothetical protein